MTMCPKGLQDTALTATGTCLTLRRCSMTRWGKKRMFKAISTSSGTAYDGVHSSSSIDWKCQVQGGC